MLVLSRKITETIVVRKNGVVVATMTVVRGGLNVRIGWEADADVEINRGEVDEQKYGIKTQDTGAAAEHVQPEVRGTGDPEAHVGKIIDDERIVAKTPDFRSRPI